MAAESGSMVGATTEPTIETGLSPGELLAADVHRTVDAREQRDTLWSRVQQRDGSTRIAMKNPTVELSRRWRR